MPVHVSGAKKALTGYMGKNVQDWSKWDATHLAEAYQGQPLEIFLDQGDADNFLLQNQLLPHNFLKKAATNGHLQTVFKQREGYDHSYFYIASFIGEHIAYHAQLLKI